MSYDRDRRDGDNLNGARPSPALAPGKSTLTSRIQRRVADAPRPASSHSIEPTGAPAFVPAAPFIDPFGIHLASEAGVVQRTAVAGHVEQQQAVSIDAPKEVEETRATLDVSPHEVAIAPLAGSTDENVGSTATSAPKVGSAAAPARLSAQQLATARRRNALHARRLRFDVAAFGGAAPDTNEFALAVAAYQTSTGGALGVDGIAGPQTCKHKGCLPAAASGHVGDQGATQDDADAENEASTSLESTRGHRDAVGAADRAQPSAIDAPKEVEETRATLPIQTRATGPRPVEAEQVHAVAAAGVEGPGGAMPHAAPIKASFGAHAPVVDGIQAHVGGRAGDAAAAIGAEAYATGNSVAFQSAPSLFTAAHEAAHVVQQQEGVQLLGGVGQVGDPYEQHADQVAAAVVSGASAERLLSRGTTAPSHSKSIGAALGASTQGEMERSFGADFSTVRLREEAPEKMGGALAVAEGEEIRAQNGALGGPDGKFLLGHELAHVVQQRGGGSMPQAKRLGASPDDMLEAEADQVGGRVARGEPAGPIVLKAPGTPQRFGASEHERMGNKGSGSHLVQLADDYALPFGEVVALAGDHFSSIEQMRLFASNKGGGAHSRLEIEYARKWKLGKHVDWNDDDQKYKEAKAAQEKRYFVLAGGNESFYTGNASHFLNPRDGDTGMSTADKATRTETKMEDMGGMVPTISLGGVGAIGNYRRTHVQAIIEAALAGKKGEKVEGALATEAFANHYLTDSFSSGHLRTPRSSAKEYWDAKVPMFTTNLAGYMGQEIARYLQAHDEDVHLSPMGVDLYPDADRFTENILWQEATEKVHGIFAAKAKLTFGDIVGLALHDWDNETGVQAHVMGQQEKLVGDGNASPGSRTEQLVVQAVATSVADVYNAHGMGKAMDPTAVVAALFSATDRVFAAERHIPTLTKEDLTAEPNPELRWKFASYTELLDSPRMRAAISKFLASKAEELEEVKSSLEPGEARAVGKIAEDMKGDPKDVLTKVIHWVPDSGGGWGGHDTDDNARDYFEEAGKHAGGRESLEVSQRIKLLNDVIGGRESEDDEETGWGLLSTATDSDAHQVIHAIGWEELARFFDGEEDDAFRATFPRAKFGPGAE
ncbi:MAG: DUF4157 domain-containing protein [Deltaproteobacteria bacterium]|nr:DUF4157 domain-containing protein [Deltaproteobacteria bacterium]